MMFPRAKKDRFWQCFCLLLAAGSGWLCAETVEFSPTIHEVPRYRHLWEKSPFTVGKPEAEASAPGLEQRFVLTAIAGTAESPVIFVLDRQSLSRTMVSGKANEAGLELVSVQPRHDPRQSWAVIRFGAEQATIKYDSNALATVNSAPDEKAKAPQSSKTQPAQAASTPQNIGKTVRRRPINLSQTP